ncbi:maleylacetoacetate isomerase-like protein [Euroglyphus maynei]|uniref:maleylacetoacetate isomerase n=1 Tax=Euroglyphus maynei TaxID=6958 RepID=A0A1Y3B6X1_EURMA|nr:maleylacetoacetate isomerase-like protein [Euroglyphus maynei]
MAVPNKFILYNYWRSSCSWRVRSVLELKQIPYEYRPVNLVKGEQYSEEFRRLNPLNQVPTLQVQTSDGHSEILHESMAIIDYLEQTFPTPSIYPKDPIERAKVITIAETIVSGIQPIQNLSVGRKIEELSDSKIRSGDWSREWIRMKFQKLEIFLKSMSGTHTFGNHLTLADFCLVPQVANAIRFKVDMDEFPLLKRLYEFLLTVEPIAKAQPSNQPDKQ